MEAKYKIILMLSFLVVPVFFSFCKNRRIDNEIVNLNNEFWIGINNE